MNSRFAWWISSLSTIRECNSSSKALTRSVNPLTKPLYSSSFYLYINIKFCVSPNLYDSKRIYSACFFNSFNSSVTFFKSTFSFPFASFSYLLLST